MTRAGAALPEFEPAASFAGIHSACFEFATASAAIALLLEQGLMLPEQLSNAVEKRRAEFLGGRYAARLALQSLGCTTDVARTSKGLPQWPTDVVGSITHAAGFAAAAVATKDMYAGIGIDAETLMDVSTAHSVQRTVAGERELALVHAALSEMREVIPPTLALTLLFSAKESFYKCVYPLTTEFLEFSEVELVNCRAEAPDRGDFALCLRRDLPLGFASGTELRGRFACVGDRVQTLVSASAAVFASNSQV